MHDERELPTVARRMLRRVLRPGERDEVMADVAEEYEWRARRDGSVRARVWLWRQVLGSAGSAPGREWLRGTSGFEAGADRMRERSGGLSSWVMDTRYALRGLRRRPQYVGLSVLTLALGIGGTTAVFGIARTLLLEPLPYEAADEVVMFWNPFDWSEAEMSYLRPEWPGLAGVAAFAPEGVFMREEGGRAQLLPGVRTTAELFDVLGTQPLLGTGFRSGDDLPGAEPTAVLSYGLWQELGGAASIVGSRLRLDGSDRLIVGVMPRGFWFPDPSVRVWLSTPLRPANRAGMYALVGRLEPGRTIAGMAEPLNRITDRLADEFTYSAEWDKTRNAELMPVTDYVLGPVRPALLATLAAMGVILLMACANVATLMLAQLRGRSSELAVRLALGAGRRRITQQLLVESGVLGLLAGLAGAVVAAFGFRLLVSALPLGELAAAVRADWSLFVTALVIAIAAAILIAVAPLFSLWRGELRDALSRARSGGIGARSGRLEDALVVGEVALALLLAASAGVLIRSVGYLSAIDPGIEAEGVGVVQVAASGDVPQEQRRRELLQIVDRIADVPGITSAAAVQQPLLRGGNNWGIDVQSMPDLEESTTAWRLVTRDYFETLGIRLLSGRWFDESDRHGGELVTVIDETLAREYFGDRDPLGEFIESGLGQGWTRVIGVVSGVAHNGLTADPEPGRYLLYEQIDYTPETATLVLRADGGRDPSAAIEQAVHLIRESGADIAVQDATTAENVLALAMGPTRPIMQLMTLLGVLALTLGAVGVYGVVSHFVNRRKRDWVIRMALGLTPRNAVAQVVARGATLVGIGCVIGIAAALALTRLLSALLFGVSPADPLTLGAAALALVVAGCCAALLPGLRAGRSNSAQVLRESA